jgi:hypothetical protein
MNNEFFDALLILEKEKGINAESLLEKIKVAIENAVKKDFGEPENIIIDNFDITCGKTVNLFTAHFVEQSKHILDDEIDGKPNANKMVPPKKIVIKNNKAGINYIKPDTAFFKDTVIVEE